MGRIRRTLEKILTFSSEELLLLTLLGVLAFLQGMAGTWADVLASGLYLGTYGRIDLAFEFVWGGFLLMPAGLLLLKTEHRFGEGYPWFLGGLFLGLAGLLAGFYQGMAWPIDVFFGLKFALQVLLLGGFWALASRFMTLTLDSKRFLGIVLLDLIGRIFGGFSAGSIAFIDGFDLFWLILIMTVFGMFLLSGWILSFQKETPEVRPTRNGGVQEPSQMKLVYLIYSAAFLIAFALCQVDYIYLLAVLETVGENKTAAMTLMGQITAFAGSTAFAGTLILYRLRHRFHLIHGLLIIALLPLLAAVGLSSGQTAIVFLADILFVVLAYCCVAYYFRMLPRPLSHGKSFRLKAMRFVLFRPLGFMAAALGFYFFPFSDFVWPAALGTAILLSGVIIGTQAEYAKVLLSAFKSFRWRGGRLIITNRKVLSYVTQKALSYDPDEAIYFLRVLEEAQADCYKSYLRRALKHPDERVRCFALTRVEKGRYRMFKKVLADLLTHDESPAVRSAVLRVLCTIGEKYAEEKAVLYLDHPDLRQGALIGLLKSGGEGILIASEGVNRLAASKSAKHRLEAAEILEETGIKGFFRLVLKLMNDEDLHVREKAVLAAGRMKHPSFLPILFRSLNSLELRDKALQAIKEFGPKAYPAISEALLSPERTWMCKKTLVSFLWINEDTEAQKILFKALKRTPFALRFDILRHLKESSFQTGTRRRRKMLLPLIQADEGQGLILKSLKKALKIAPVHEAQEAFELLQKALDRELQKVRHSLLMELALLYPAALFRKAVDCLLSRTSSAEQRRMALELIEDQLPRKQRRLKVILKTAQETAADEKAFYPTSQKDELSMNEALAILLKNKSYRLPWTKACALLAIRKIGEVSLTSTVTEMLTDTHPLIREGAVWALGRLVPEEQELLRLLMPLKDDPVSAVRLTVQAVLEE